MPAFVIDISDIIDSTDKLLFKKMCFSENN